MKSYQLSFCPCAHSSCPAGYSCRPYISLLTPAFVICSRTLGKAWVWGYINSSFLFFTVKHKNKKESKWWNQTRLDPCPLSRSLPTWNNITNIMVATQWSCDPPYRTCWKNTPRSLSRERTVLQFLTPPASNGPPLHTHCIHSVCVHTAVMFCM